MKRLLIISIMITMLFLVTAIQAQTYYNLRYSWEQIDDAIAAVRDTFPGLIASKLDNEVSHLELPENPGVPILVNLSVWGSPLDTEHGYIFAVDSVSVIRVAAHTTDGDDTDSYSVTIGASEPDPDYTLTGPAIASRWDVAGADFAEYFEAGEELGLGVAVVFDEVGRVREAREGEKPFGIVSAGAGFIGNSGRPALPILTTALGDTIYQEVQYVQVTREARFPMMKSVTSWVPAARLSEIPENAKIETRREAVANPDYGKAYIPHRKNDKMVLVGLVGQLPLKKGQVTHPNWFRIKALDTETELWLVK
jgi:hypothetical protein